MDISYDRLWKRLIDEKMKKTDLIELAKISSSTLSKLSKDQIVSLDVLIKICYALECDIGDIVSIRR